MRRGQVIIGVVTTYALVLALVVPPALAVGGDDDAIAREAVLKLSDLPDGWETKPSGGEDEPFGTRECRGVDRAFTSIYDEIDGKPRAYEEPETTAPDTEITATDVENSIALFPTVRAAKRVFRVLETDETFECFDQAARDSAAELGVREGTLESFDVAAGDEVVGFSIVLGDGVRAESFFLDLVLARVGRAIALFSAFNIGSSLPEGPDVLDAVVGRLERAL